MFEDINENRREAGPWQGLAKKTHITLPITKKVVDQERSFDVHTSISSS